jgi:hypothetical protein
MVEAKAMEENSMESKERRGGRDSTRKLVKQSKATSEPP